MNKTLTILTISTIAILAVFLTHLFVETNVEHSKNIECNKIKGDFRDGLCYLTK